MGKIEAIGTTDLETWLAAHKEWRAIGDTLSADFRFKDFTAAFAFITRVAELAEEQNHHPQIINMYNNVTLNMNTHEAGNRITQRDLTLAEAIGEI